MIAPGSVRAQEFSSVQNLAWSRRGCTRRACARRAATMRELRVHREGAHACRVLRAAVRRIYDWCLDDEFVCRLGHSRAAEALSAFGDAGSFSGLVLGLGTDLWRAGVVRFSAVCGQRVLAGRLMAWMLVEAVSKCAASSPGLYVPEMSHRFQY